MNSATFLVLRLALGLSAHDVAQRFDVALRTAQRWESTHTPPEDVADWIRGQWSERVERAGRVLDLADHTGQDPVTLFLRRDPQALMDDQGMSIGEHRSLLGQIAFALALEELDVEILDMPGK